MSGYHCARRRAIRPRNEDRRIRILAQPDVIGSIAEISTRNQPVGAELLVDGQVPLLHIAGAEIQRHIDVNAVLGEECAAAAGRREGERKWRDRLSLIRVRQSSSRPRDGYAAAERAVVSKPVKIKLFRVVIEQAVSCPDCFLALASWVPVKAYAWRKVCPMTVHIRTSRLCIATVEETRRRVRKYLAHGARGERGGIEVAAPLIPVSRWEVGFPTNAEVQSQVGPHAVTILGIQTVVTLPPVLLFIVALSKGLYCAQHEVDQGIAAGAWARGATKGKLPIALEAGKLIELAVDPIKSEGECMLPLRPIDVVRDVQRIVVEVTRCGGTALHVEIVAEAQNQVIRYRAGDVDSELCWIRNVGGRTAEDRHPVRRNVNGVDHRHA